MSHMLLTRRRMLQGMSAIAGVCLVPSFARAQTVSLKIAALVPLTGGGSLYGPAMQKTAQAVVDEVNQAGGVLGRPVELITQDDQTNPESAVRTASRLIDVDRVAALVGLWASGVTSAVVPLAWQGKTALFCESGADSITQLPHQGYVFRTQPVTVLQGRKMAEFALGLGAKRGVYLGPQSPFTQAMIVHVGETFTHGGGQSFDSVVYEEKKTSYRAELDRALRSKPDVLMLGGFVADTAVLAKDIYRAGFTGKIVSTGFGVNQQLLDAVPANVANGIYTTAPSPEIDSPAYKHLGQLLASPTFDTYSCQVYDQVNLCVLAAAYAKQASGTAIRDSIRKIAGTAGQPVSDAVSGLKLLAAGKPISYTGASGPCKFDDRGDILDCKFRYDRVTNGKLQLLKVA